MEDRDKRLVSETQVKEIVTELLKYLTFDDNEDLKKHIMDKQIKKLRTDMSRVDIMTESTTELTEYSRKIYIPVNIDSNEPFNLRFTLLMDEMTIGQEVLPATTHSFGLMLMNNFNKDINLMPVCYFINPELRKVMEKVTISVLKVVTDYFIEIDFNKEPEDLRILTTFVNIMNKDGYVNLATPDILNGVEITKTSEVNLFPVVGFDDIPERDNLVRSSTITRYEIKSEEAYKLLEDENLLDEMTVYSIPEELGINE